MKFSELKKNQLERLRSLVCISYPLNGELVDKLIAWCIYRNLEVSSLKEITFKYDILNIDSEQVMILNDYEAREMFENYLDLFIDENIIPELPERYRQYFDSEKWKYDIGLSCRGNWLSQYDGVEHELADDYYGYIM